MINRQITLGGPIHLSFSSAPSNTRLVTLIVDGVVSSTSTSVSNIATSIYQVTFTPSSTGIFDVFVDGVQIASVEIVSRSLFDFLHNIEDVSLGSWEWDKSTKVLNLYRLNGELLATYDSDDTPELAFNRYISE